MVTRVTHVLLREVTRGWITLRCLRLVYGCLQLDLFTLVTDLLRLRYVTFVCGYFALLRCGYTLRLRLLRFTLLCDLRCYTVGCVCCTHLLLLIGYDYLVDLLHTVTRYGPLPHFAVTFYGCVYVTDAVRVVCGRCALRYTAFYILIDCSYAFVAVTLIRCYLRCC